MKTLVIIDLQNDFLIGGSLAVPEGNSIIPIINQVQSYFDLIVATMDWHPNNHKSFAANYADKKPFEKILIHGLEQTLWPRHCVQGSVGAAFPDTLETNSIAAIFRKGMDPEVDSYSGFYDNAHQKSTGLAGYLREKKAQDLYFCGLAADICVYFSIKDALKAGFTCFLIEDATRPLDEKEFESIKLELLKEGVKFVHSAQIML